MMAVSDSSVVTAVQVQNYRNILDSGKVPLEEITTLLGKNESGKTSFLEAINSFSTTYNYTDRKLCNFRERKNLSDTPIVTLYFEIDDINNQLYSDHYHVDLGDSSSAEFSITKFADNTYDLSAGREVTKIYADYYNSLEKAIEEAESVESYGIQSLFTDDASQKTNSVKTAISNIKKGSLQPLNLGYVNRILGPGINRLMDIYNEAENTSEKFDDIATDFAEILTQIRSVFYPVLPQIVYHHEYEIISNSANIGDLRRGEHPTFQNLLSLGDTSADEIQSLEGIKLDNKLNSVAQRAAIQINRFWSQKNIDLRLIGDHKELRLHVVDREADPNKPLTQEPISDRSDGFKWFFSFYVNLSAEHGSMSRRNQLLLLDEPAIHLHPKGKRDWLSTVEETVETTQILYTSHSPYLVRKSHPSRIRAIELEDGGPQATVTSNILGSDEDTFEPLRESLGIGLGHSPFVSKRQIVVEGASDYYILAGVAAYYENELDRNILDWSEIAITPAGGATKVPDKAVWLASEEIKYSMLLDSDSEGRDVKDDIGEKYHTLENGPERTVMLRSSRAHQNVAIEDMFPPEFYVECFNEVYERFFEDFEQIEVEDTDEGRWEIKDEDYEGEMITEVLKDILVERGMCDEDDDIAKVPIADVIKQRLSAGEVKEEDVADFNQILVDLQRHTT